ncbi:methyltransferase domain-containing protein [Acidovorax lacteus]|uniref:Methyltransferase domain-containing protein n=1 Tax=Acidovorax lacteus TaxID=1924988 RepID=A0ABP8L7X0_9BURK
MPTESHDRPPTIDPVAAAQWRRRAPALTPWLHEEVGRRMEERLQWILRKPAAWCDWEPVRGGLETHARIRERYPDARCHLVLDNPAHEALARRAHRQPWWSPARWRASTALRWGDVPDASVEMLWANMALHLSADPQALLARWHRALAVDGFLMFSCLGPDTVRELRALYEACGWPPPGHAFTDMHDWGDMLVHQGFAEPIMDMERITLTFETPERLLLELRGLGRNLHPERHASLRGRGWHRQLLQSMMQRLSPAGSDGPLALTFEVIYGHAFKPTPRARLESQSTVSLQDMRSMLRLSGIGGKR